MRREIAIYGKGGIGKSTIAANLSAALAVHDRVLQIGCDPKHDSTRLLTGGRQVPTILEYLRETGPADVRLEDILRTGYRGIGCLEAGGPRPGVGCAGRGIITAFELLDKFRLKENYDTVIYDVLGDVVCGGFAVPIRREFADRIFLVTSGEFMSIYAANNILRGIRNYDEAEKRVAGIIFNRRNVEGEDDRIRAFARAVDLPVFAAVPRSDAFAKAERAGKTLVEMDLPPAEIFAEMAERIREGIPLFEAKPLRDEELEELILGAGQHSPAAEAGSGDAGKPPEGAGDAGAPIAEGTGRSESAPICRKEEAPAENRAGREAREDAEAVEEPSGEAGRPEDVSSRPGDETAEAPAPAYDPGVLSKNLVRNEPLHGCAFNGAVSMGVHLRDAVIVAHGPKSCAYLSWQTVSSTGRRAMFERGTLMPSSILPSLTATDMDEADMVFGGTDKLVEAVRRAVRRGKAVLVISTCPAGIIGDDLEKAAALSAPECPVVTIRTDGNLAGDYLQGMLMAYTQIAARLIDPKVRPEGDRVNIVFEKVVAKNTETNYRMIKGFLERMGVEINCRFLCDASVEEVRNFCRAPLNLLGYRDYTGKILQQFFEENYGSRFYEAQLPVGFQETAKWLRGIGAFFGREEEAEAIISEHEDRYRERIARVRPGLQGKRLLILTFNHQLDWVISAALDAGMEIVKIGVFNFSQDEGFRSVLPETAGIDVEENYDPARREEDIARLRPDVLLTNYEFETEQEDLLLDTIPMCPDTGFFSGLEMAERWSRMSGHQQEGSWKNDRHLPGKYFAR